MRDQTISYKDLHATVDDHGYPHGMENAIENAIREVNYHDEQIKLGAERVARIARDVAVKVNQGAGLNELGEFQAHAADVDRHIALRHAAYTTLSALVGDEAGRLATSRFVAHLTDAHHLMTPLDKTDLGSLRAQHAIAMDQHPSEAAATCDQFVG